MSTLGAYRGLKRLTSAATFLLFGASLIVGVFYAGNNRDYWPIAKWTGIGAPLVVTLAILCLLSFGWTAPGLANAPQRLAKIRIPPALWILLGIEIPWIAAWFGADAGGRWLQQSHAALAPGFYLWGARLLAGVVTYALASAIGVLVTILVDMHLSERRSAGPD